MLTIDSYRKGWALRYMREARAELVAAQKTPTIAHGLMLEAMRKAQAAIYYSLGDPAFIESIVYQAFNSPKSIDKEPVLNCLLEIEKTVQRISQHPDPELLKTFEEVDYIIEIASNFVELLTGEKA